MTNWIDETERWLVAVFRSLKLVAEELAYCRCALAALWGRHSEDEMLDEKACAVSAPRVVESPRRTYELEAKIAAGDLCDVYLACEAQHRDATDRRFVVKAPRVTGRAADSLMAKEFRVLRRLVAEDADPHYARYFPAPVESFVAGNGGPRYNVLAWEDGYFTSGEILTRHPAGLEGRHLAWMFKRVLVALGYAHRRGWIHGAVLPPHLLFHAENHGLRLTGWIHAVRSGKPLALVPAEFKSWYPPECKFGATPASDIYLAAQCLVYLAGGDPVRRENSQKIPAPMRQFLQACLLESPRMRPQDAWELHDEFDELLADLYGPPRYVKLEMS